MTVNSVNGVSDAAASFESAHRTLKADRSIQFQRQAAHPPPQPPAWLKAVVDWREWVFAPVGRFFSWLASFMPDAPVARVILYTALILAAVAFIWLAWMRFSTGEWRLFERKFAEPTELAEEEWAPEAAPARRWLDEADALAAEGRFAEAIHHLLFRSVEDLARRRPDVVRPALTSRELAAAGAIPAAARCIFAGIAALVERSFFGGRPVGEQDWSTARTAYSDFALTKVWKA